MAATSLKAEQLRDAFEIFNRQSGMLEESYRELQGKVALLTRQLRQAQSERLAELEPFRDRLHKGELTILEFLQSENLRLACDLLVHYAHWVTPPTMPTCQVELQPVSVLPTAGMPGVQLRKL